MEKMVKIPESEYLQMTADLETLRNSDLMKKILKAKEELKKEVYSRKDLGF